MTEAIIGLIGVVIGGVIGIVGQIIVAHFANKIWKKEKRIENLRIKRDKLEAKYNKCASDLFESLKTDLYDMDSSLDVIHSFSTNIYDAFFKVIANKKVGKPADDLKLNIGEFIAETKKSLNEIDTEIQKEIDS